MKQTAFFDIDTQLDFLVPAGALYAPLAERVIPHLGRLNRHAIEKGFALISTVDAHSENDGEFSQWPPHCISGTTGQHKAQATLIGEAVIVPNQPDVTLPTGITRQIIVEKQSIDCFTNPHFVPLVRRLGIGRCVVYGVVTEVCVRCAAFGLLKLGLEVALVTDAVQHLRTEARDRMIQDFQSGGGRLVTTQQVLAG